MKGQGLIEVVVAMGIISVVITSITVVVTRSLSDAQLSTNKNTATKYAQEGMELLHNIRDSDYSIFKALNGNYCLANGQTTLGATSASCPNPNVGQFIRSIQIQQNPGCAANVASATVKVAWSDGQCPAATLYCHTVALNSCLSAVSPIQAP